MNITSKQSSRHNPKFTIEDAFEEDVEDTIRIYGATNERSPLKPKPNQTSVDDMKVHVEDPAANASILTVNDRRLKTMLTVPDVDAISRDSDSLIPGDGSYLGGSEGQHWWFMHPKVREKWRIVAGAFILLIMGIVLITTGIVVEVVPVPSLSGFVFLLAGLICFIPGAYHVVYIMLAVRGQQGYDFYNLPLFN
ncbi:transmembrane protein 134 [Oratosquilla oratoria]|uniref:transmembrane protein 134 n=1 Tax=Oratosquilla oratoria TaxID=337810 RepID=UPI003F7761DC